MNAQENGGFENHGQRTGDPQTYPEEKTAEETMRENRDIETNDQREKASDRDGGENMQETGKQVAAASFWFPALRRLSLETMENAAHQNTARNNREKAGDEARRKGGAKRVHDEKMTMSILGEAAFDCRFWISD